jgi:hypothetical protein
VAIKRRSRPCLLQAGYIAETIGERVTKPGYDFGDEFEFGLGLILDGLEPLRGTA